MANGGSNFAVDYCTVANNLILRRNRLCIHRDSDRNYSQELEDCGSFEKVIQNGFITNVS